MVLTIALILIAIGLFGVRWFYKIARGFWVAGNAFEPLVAIAMVGFGIIGLRILF